VGLQKYHSKRQFDRTPEPEGALKHAEGPLRFVVQKHRARSLHYDFRLEAEGTLKSWAVPKGPSLNPDDKRLAIMVEDHPLDYASFEGIIPQGNYGAGTVMVWDEGDYDVLGASSRAEAEKSMAEGLVKGGLKFVLHGKKLRGEFALFKLKRGEQNAWLLVKKRDAFATDGPIADDDRSVVTQRTMAEIAEGAQPRTPAKEATKITIREAPKAAFPRRIKPMLATFVAEAFDDPNWIFEIKWDGYRAIAEVTMENVRLYSRNNLPFEDRYAPVVESLRQLGHEAVLDGEIVVLDGSGKAQFQLLQAYQSQRRGTLTYFVFDLLYLDGQDLRDLPLMRRKELLARIVNNLPHIRLSEHIEEHGKAFLSAAAEQELEGIVAKEKKSTYQTGRRSRSWLKIKTRLRQEAIIAGFTEPRGSRKDIGSVVLGVYEGNELVYIGHAGSGFTAQSLADLHARLEPLITKACPFRQRPKTNAPPHWVEPRLVCEVQFGGWTTDGLMRHPIFQGLREDKPLSEVRRETPELASRGASALEGVPASAPAGPAPALPLAAGLSAGRVSIGGRELELTNLTKVYWPDEGYTKRDLIEYYREVARVILPYLKDRPESLHRHPNGIRGKSFFQKDVRRQPPPEWVQLTTLHSESARKEIRALVCQDEATLVYLANLGCIELNPTNARVSSLDRPDYLLMDLDPEETAFDQVVEVAQAVRKLLEQVGAEGCCKTSGKRGLHIYVPTGARYSHDQAKLFAELIAQVVNRRLPDISSLVRDPAKRRHRVYLDWLQNGKDKTLAAPYSARPYPGATVSTPLKWTEVKRGLDPAKFTIRTLAKRLDKVGDLWQPVLGAGINLQGCLERMGSLLRNS
jgi:bifunctional non-homologous end joining protein LigD